MFDGVAGTFEIFGDPGKLAAELRELAVHVFRGATEVAESDLDVLVARQIGLRLSVFRQQCPQLTTRFVLVTTPASG